jgi:DNA polymerase I
MAKRAKLMLIDGNALFHRGYHAIPHLTNKEGEPTNAVYGFANMLFKAIGDLKPDYAIVAWDKAGKTFRDEMYSEYKATRTKQPDDLYAQMPVARELIDAMGIPFIELANYEADDIIGTLAAKAKDVETIIVTGDLDELQLIDETTKVYALRRGMTDTKIYDLAALKERYGLTPEQFIDLKALKGDSSDNIPGVPGVGEKTAMTLIQQYGSLDGVYEHLDELKGKLKERLEENKELAYLSQKLSHIVCDAPVELDLDAARLGQYDRQRLQELFRRLDFKSLLSKLPAEVSAEPNLFSQSEPEKVRRHIENAEYHCVQSPDQLSDLVAKLENLEVFAFDTETDSLDIMTANLVGMAFSFKEGEAYYIPLGHQGEQLTKAEVFDALRQVLENGEVKKTGHNIKFDYQILKRHGINMEGIVFDTMIAAFLLNPLARAQTLSDLAYSELGIEMIELDELIVKKGINQSSFDAVAIEDATRYAAEDADVSWRLYGLLKAQLEETGLSKLASDMEWPLICVLGDMELAGIELDSNFLKEFNLQISKRILELEEKICELAGERFNISSPAQLSQILFGKLGLVAPGVRRGKTGGLSTAARELDKLRGLHPIVELIFEHRELVKLKTTYVDALPKQVGPDGRIHTSFSQVIAQTGRLSSNNPNLQNIPVRTELGREIRKAFVAPKGRIFVSADYSQIELRVAAALAKDEQMIKAFDDGIDIHALTAAELYGVPLDEVTKEQRYNSKTVNFGVLYGMSSHGLSVATGMSRDEAAGFIKRYYEVRPQLAKYIEDLKAFAREKQYTETLFGRRRPCPEINSNNFQVAAAAERYAVNVPIQGTAADLMKLAMIKLAGLFDGKTQMLLQIHDELIVETDKDNAEAVASLMKESMEKVYDLGVRIEVDTASASTWGGLD